MKLIIPHIHKTLGDAGFFARISQKGEIKDLRVMTLEGLRQIEGILIGRRVFETPLVISRICGICPTSHILNACRALEKALAIKVSLETEHLRRLITSAQIIQSHSAHIFFMSLADFFNIDNDMDLVRKFPKEAKAALKLRDFALKIIELIGGRTVHPITPVVGGFSKVPKKEDIKKVLNNYSQAYQSALTLVNLCKKLDFPELNRETIFASSFDSNEYSYNNGEKIKIKDEIISIGDFFSNQIEEDLKNPPTKKVEFQGGPYMVGAIARIKNNSNILDSEIESHIKDFKRDNSFKNAFHNTFFQSLELLIFLKEAEKNLSLLLKEEAEPSKKYELKKGSGLAALEAPRGTLFSYFETDKDGRISNCSIITPTAQFLRNLEEDLKILLLGISGMPQDKKIRKIKTLIRAYDPCISCAVH